MDIIENENHTYGKCNIESPDFVDEVTQDSTKLFLDRDVARGAIDSKRNVAQNSRVVTCAKIFAIDTLLFFCTKNYE